MFMYKTPYKKYEKTTTKLTNNYKVMKFLIYKLDNGLIANCLKDIYHKV